MKKANAKTWGAEKKDNKDAQPGTSSSTPTRRRGRPAEVRRPPVNELPTTSKSPQAKRIRTNAGLTRKTEKALITERASSSLSTQAGSSRTATANVTSANPLLLLVQPPPVIDLCTPPVIDKAEGNVDDYKSVVVIPEVKTEKPLFEMFSKGQQRPQLASDKLDKITGTMPIERITCIRTHAGPSTSTGFECKGDAMEVSSKRRKTEANTATEFDTSLNVLFDCPTLGLTSLKEVEMHRKIFKYLLHQPDDGSGQIQSLMIHSCNAYGENLTKCIFVLVSHLNDLIDNPDHPRAKIISCQTLFFKQYMFYTLGLAQFFKIVGFTAYHDAYRFEGDAREAKPRLKMLKLLLVNTEPIPIHLSRNLKVFKPGTPVTEYTSLSLAARRSIGKKFQWSSLHKKSSVKYTEIVVQFPDTSALMGTFKTTELVADVYEFVRNNLVICLSEFVLKNILYEGVALNNSQDPLIASRQGLVPTAILGFQYRLPNAKPPAFLKPELFYEAK